MKGANSIGEAVKYRRNLDLIKKMTSHPLYIKPIKTSSVDGLTCTRGLKILY